MTQRYVAALDQGTTSTRCMLFDHRGRTVAVAQREHRQMFPRPGWVEYDAVEIWDVVQRVVPDALRDAGVDAGQVAALSVTNQRETAVLWDRGTGRPVRPAISWQDTRAAGVMPAVVEEIGGEAELRDRCGLPAAGYFSGPKLRWLFESDPRLLARAEAGELLFGTMDSWLVWNLTGGVDGGIHVTDVTNASRTMLLNLRTLAWDPDLLRSMRVPAAILPEVRPSLAPLASSRQPVPGIPITSLIGEQQASLFGQTAFEAGEAKCTFGTGGFLLLNTGTRIPHSHHGLVATVAYACEGEEVRYALEGSIAVTGALVRWCRDSLGLVRSVPEIETLARTVDDNGGLVVVPAFSGLYALHWVPNARGLFVGLTSYITKGHIARAVLEASAWQARDVIDAMQADADLSLRRLAVDGGMTANNLFMQVLADALGIPVVRPMMAETVALGAAYGAGLVAGYWSDREGLRAHWNRAAEWRPEMDEGRRAGEHASWRKAVQLAVAWAQVEEETGR